MDDGKRGRKTLQKASATSKEKPKLQGKRSRVSEPVLTPTVTTVTAALTPTLPYQQKQNNGGFLPEVLTTPLMTSTTTATSRHHAHHNFVNNKGIGQNTAAATPTSNATVTGVRTGAGAEGNLLAPSILTPLPVVKSITKVNGIQLIANPRQVNSQSSSFLASTGATARTAGGGAASAGSAIGAGKFGYRRSLAGDPTSKTFTATKTSLSAAATAGSADTNPEECELAHAQVAGGCIQIKKHQQQQQYNEYKKKAVIDTGDDDDDSKHNNSNNNNFHSKSVSASVVAATNITNNSNISKSLHGNSSVIARSSGGGGESSAESFNVKCRAMPDVIHQRTDGSTIAAGAPATGNKLAYTNNDTNLLSPITTSTDNTNTMVNATPAPASSTKDGVGYLGLKHVQNNRLFYPRSTNKTGSASSRHLQNTSQRSFSALTTSASGVVRSSAGGMPTEIGTDTGMDTGNYFNYKNINNNIVGINNTTTAATAPRLVAASTITNDNNNRSSGSGNNATTIGSTIRRDPDPPQGNNRPSRNYNASMDSNINYMHYRHLFGSNNYDLNKKQQEQVPQRQQQTQHEHERERNRDQYDDIKFIDSDEITPTRTVSPYNSVGSAKAQIIKPSLNDNPPIYLITPPFQDHALSQTERGTQHTHPKTTTILPTTSKGSSATTYGGGGTGSGKIISSSGVVTIPQQQQREQFAKAAAVAVLNAGQPTAKAATTIATTATTTAADNIDTLGIKSSIGKVNSLSDQKKERPLVGSNTGTINTNNITKAPATAAFAASNVGVSNAVKNISTAGGGGVISANILLRYNTEGEHQSTSMSSRLDAGYSHSLKPEMHYNNSGGINSLGNIGGREGFGAGADASHNSRTSTNAIASTSSPIAVTNKNIIAGIHHSTRPAATVAATTSSVPAITVPRPRLGLANYSGSNSNSYSNERSTIRALNSIENIASGGAIPTTMATVTATTTTLTFESTAIASDRKSVRNVDDATRTFLPPVSPIIAATQHYRERENSGSSSVIRGSQTLPTSTMTSLSSLATSKYSSTASEGLCGLRNIGNTCFMNSVIQCLSHTTDLTKFLRSHHGSRSETTKDQQILYEFAKLIQNMWTAGVHSVTPMELKRAFSIKHRMYSDFNQQDAQEFLRFFLDSLHSALNTGIKNETLNIDDNLSDNKKADLTWEWYTRHDNSLIRDLFVGQLKSTLKCTTCGNTSVTFDPFWDLSVSLPSSSRCKLEACLDMFIREEVLDGDEMPTCSKCRTRRKCTKGFTIQRFPKYLVIHLKRFSETRSKLSNIVEFPTGDRELNMRPYAANPSSSVQYSLYAVSNHMGSTSGGHYVALCKHPVSCKWHEFNDSIVSDPIIESHLVSSCAYILFYERA